MSKAPDVTDPNDIRSVPDDPRVARFEDDPVVVVMYWTPDLQGPKASNSVDDLLGYSKEAVAEHTEKYRKWIHELQTHLAAARYVIVRNWFSNSQTVWDPASISKIKGDMNQKIQYQGPSNLSLDRLSFLIVAIIDAKMRAKMYHLSAEDQENFDYHATLPFHKFIEEGISNPDSCGNCLDSPGLRAEVPPFIM
jgi:hypothetical protein